MSVDYKPTVVYLTLLFAAGTSSDNVLIEKSVQQPFKRLAIRQWRELRVRGLTRSSFSESARSVKGLRFRGAPGKKMSLFS